MATSSEYLPSDDYEERVYAGVLGKIIGVYLGRPFEGWSNERIERELGEINYYVHERLNAPLIVTDDDISGTFTFVRALAENGNDPNLTAAQIGDWWLNTIIEGRTILWWGGLGDVHRAYGLPAAQGGTESAGQRQHRHQWARLSPSRSGRRFLLTAGAWSAPATLKRRRHLARKAASVSHDGEAIYGAQVVAAMEAQAFVERDLNTLLDTAAALDPEGQRHLSARSATARLGGSERRRLAGDAEEDPGRTTATTSSAATATWSRTMRLFCWACCMGTTISSGR